MKVKKIPDQAEGADKRISGQYTLNKLARMIRPLRKLPPIHGKSLQIRLSEITRAQAICCAICISGETTLYNKFRSISTQPPFGLNNICANAF